MPNEYNGTKVVLRDTDGNQMSLPRFFQIGLVGPDGEDTAPSQGSHTSAGHVAWDIHSRGVIGKIPARCPVSGTVVLVETKATDTRPVSEGNPGRWVIVKEDTDGSFERYHRFMHLYSFAVQVGDKVNQGTSVGLIGSTGSSTGPHLHYDVTLNTTSPQGSIHPLEAFDEATLPDGWNMEDAANAGNWNYIPLDTGGKNYGPAGGEVPSEPYDPGVQCYDIAWPQVKNGSLDQCINAIADANPTSGVIIQIGSFQSSGFVPAGQFDTQHAVETALNRGLGLGIYFYDYVNLDQDITSTFQDGAAWLQSIGATPDKVNMGIWIDIEESGHSYDPALSPDKEVNFAFIKRFMDVFTNAGYFVSGPYGNAGIFRIYPNDKMVDVPVWAAMPEKSFENASRSDLDRYLPPAYYTKVYLYQHTWRARVNNWPDNLDGNKILQPMPTAGSQSSSSGSTANVMKIDVTIVPPKRIYFSPVPGLIDAESDVLTERKVTVDITTDADNADLYYTVDGSSPYQYTQQGDTTAYTLAANATLYTAGIELYKDTHIRVIAVPTGTVPGGLFTEPLAKGSGTFLFRYRNLVQGWDAEKKSYSTSEDNVSFFEENRQAFLRLHNTLTDEEILYATAYYHDTQVAEDNATDNATTTSTTNPDVQPMT